MKKLITVTIISSICIASYFLIFAGIKSDFSYNAYNPNAGNTSIVISQFQSRNFINCIFNEAYESWNHQAWVLKFLDRYKDSLHFNTIHYYNYPEVSNYYGSFNSLMNQTQINHNIDLLDSVEAKNLVTFTARQNIEKYCYGQSLTYEVSSAGSTTLNDGFCYQNVMSNTYTIDSGRTVLHARPWPSDNYNNAGYLCKSIYENLQHTDIYDFVQLDAGDWFLRPMMRIDTSIFRITNTTPVVAIVAVNYSGSPIDSIVIRVNNFKNDSNKYEGNYQGIFKFEQQIDSLKTSGSPSTGLGNDRDDDFTLWENNCKVDFRVYWFGQVEVWFDKMTVDDERANRMFNPIAQQIKVDSLIKQEANFLGDHPANFSFFVDEVVYSNYPCINYIDSILKSENPNAKLHTAITNYFHIRSFKNNEVGQSVYFKNTHLNSFNADAHVIDLYTKLPNNFLYYDPKVPPLSVSSSYNEYNTQLQNAVFGDRNSITPENVSFSNDNPPWWGSLVYQVVLSRKNRDLYSKDAQFIMQPQIHSNAFKKNSDQYFQFGNREPTNEEIQAEAMISIAHGAEGLCWFIYPSVKSVYNSGTLKNYYQGIGGIENSDTTFVYNYGLTKLLQDYSTLPPRDSNLYAQNKWDYVKKMNIKLEHWKSTLDKIVFDSGHSSHSEGANHNFISDFKSFYSIAIPPFSSSTIYEDSIKYWEIGFLNPDLDNPDVSSNDKSKYFIMVNRRCFPNINNDGDLRQLKIKFDSTDLQGFRNWKIIDLDSNNIIRTFDKDSNIYVDMRIYLPGEGKLYKLAPVMQEGGTLVTNEDCSGEFDCKGEVNNNGYNINIRPGTRINFADSTARIIMTEGNFTSGIIPSDNSAPVYLKGKNGIFWKGLLLQNCPNVEIVRTYFEDISPYGLYSTYAANIINSRFVNVSYCSFLSEPGLNTGGVNAIFTIDDEDLEIEAYILNNYFEMDNGEIQALTILTSGYVTFPVLVEGNTFVSSSENSFNAMLFAGVEGGAIKNNTMTGYKNGIILIWSAMDFYGNTFSGGDEDSKGILLYASSYANLAETGTAYTGGSNLISCEGENAKCIEVDYSLLYLNKGFNTFDIKNYRGGDAFHLTGTLSDEMYTDPVYATQNCFQLSELNSEAIYNMLWPSKDTVNYYFLDFNCDNNPFESMIAFDLGNGKYDTIYTESGGSGGGRSNYELKENAELTELITVRSLEDSVSINLRKRDYNRVSDLCYELLTDHIDSLKDVSIISKLYLAELRLDSSGGRITNLKSFLEEFILNNPDKATFVKQSFYVIQKCKVSLEMYESAMSGFQEIINQNLYSYDGLVASWDYAATSLLFEGGGGAGISNFKLQISNDGSKEDETKNNNDEKFQIQNSNSQIFSDDPKDKYDSKRFTKEDRKVLKSNVVNSFQTSREKEIEIVKSLEKKVREGNANKNEKSELKVKKTLSEVIKIKKPKDISEHINTIYGNIQKVFGSVKDNYSNEIINIIPTEYSLSQNYPNPFNPITHLEFGISNLGFVTLKVYDILGREVKTLINEIRPAGIYKAEFDGSNFASGVYFYRIEAGDFVQTKRMVLVK